MIKIVLRKIKRIRRRHYYKKINTIIDTEYFSDDLVCGSGCIIGRDALISNNVNIGNFTYINTLNGRTTIESNTNIGSFCSIASGVLIGLGNHHLNFVTTHPILCNKYYAGVFNDDASMIKLDGLPDKDLVTNIMNDVWIGANVFIKRGLTIGNGSVIAAASVVTKDVPSYAIVGGNPAKIIKMRFDESIIKELENMKEHAFWTWPQSVLFKRIDYLYDIDAYINYLHSNK